MILTISGAKLTCSLQVSLTSTLSPGLTLPKAAVIVFPASQSTATVAALAASAEKQKTARRTALLLLMQIAVLFIVFSDPLSFSTAENVLLLEHFHGVVLQKSGIRVETGWKLNRPSGESAKRAAIQPVLFSFQEPAGHLDDVFFSDGNEASVERAVVKRGKAEVIVWIEPVLRIGRPWRLSSSFVQRLVAIYPPKAA